MNKSDSHPSRSGSSQKAAIVTPINSHRRQPLQAKQASEADAEQIKRLEETIAQLPEVNATRVVQLHQRIMSGEYKIDSRRLAEKLLDLEGLLSR